MATLGQAIVKARVDKRLKQKDLQDLSGLSQRYLSALEHDKVDPRLTVVRRIAHALGLTLAQLVEGTVASGQLLEQKEQEKDGSKL
jgi:transcriptional regulator with XRE-family HTH domain